MDLSRLRRLMTREDIFNIHKILGIGALSHFAFRIIYGFHVESNSIFSHLPFWLLIHLTLSTSSLVFHIPQNRIRSAPMIWPEFRLHSILFAYRSLLCCLVVLYVYPVWLMIIVRHALLLATLHMADRITVACKQHDNRLGTTMRGMPMPESFTPFMQSVLNYFYSISQICATLTVIVPRANDLIGPVFWPTLPIQLAPFFMTLVRKGIMSSFMWHVGYSVALLWNFIYGYLQVNDFPIVYWVYLGYFCMGRFVVGTDKYFLWYSICLVNVVQSLQYVS